MEWNTEEIVNDFTTTMMHILMKKNNDAKYHYLSNCLDLLNLLNVVNPETKDGLEILLFRRHGLTNEFGNHGESRIIGDGLYYRMNDRVNELRSIAYNNNINFFNSNYESFVNENIPILNFPQVRNLPLLNLDNEEYINLVKSFTMKFNQNYNEILNTIINKGRLHINNNSQGNVAGIAYSITSLQKSYIYIEGINTDYFISLPHELSHTNDYRLLSNIQGDIAYTKSLCSETYSIFTELVFLDSLKNSNYAHLSVYNFQNLLLNYQDLISKIKYTNQNDKNNYTTLLLYMSYITAFHLYYLYKNNIGKFQELKKMYENNIINFNTNIKDNQFLESCIGVDFLNSYEYVVSNYSEFVRTLK